MDLTSVLYPTRDGRQKAPVDSTAFIDPGLGGTGVAIFPAFSTKATKATLVAPRCCECFTAKRKSTTVWQSQVADVVAMTSAYVAGAGVLHVVIEMPEVWAESSKSMAAATRGDIGKLIYLIGGLGEAFRRLGLGEPTLIPPRLWKGQLPKDIVTARIKDVFGTSFGNHVDDAVGMGLAAQGAL